MGDADVKLTTVSTDGTKLSNLIPDGSMTKAEGKSALPGKYTIPGVEGAVTLKLVEGGSKDGPDVTSVETPFGKAPLLGKIEESEDKFGLHITLGGFPMKAWLKKDGSSTVLQFSNGGKWTKLESKL